MSVTRVRKNLPVGALVLDPVVQRIRHQVRPAMREATVQRLFDNWDIAKCEALIARPLDDGTYAIGHGGHRLQVARLLNLHSLPCDVVQGINGGGDQYWVDLCLAPHKARGWEPLNEFLVKLEVGSEPEASIEGILNKHGARTATSPDVGYVCVDKLRKLYDLDLLFPTVFVIESAWPRNAYGHSGLMVEAIGTFIWAYSKHPAFDDNALADKLARRSPVDLIRDARSRNAAMRTGVLRILCGNLRDIYNKGRRTVLPEFKMPRRPVGK